jgi:hypothetical protein
MKLTKGALWALTIVGAGLVSQGLITGEQLTSIQNIVGLALGGGGITAIGIIGILTAIPKQVVTSAFDKATEKYGEDKVLGFLNNIDTIILAVETLTGKVDTIQAELDVAKEQRNQLLG